MKTQSRRQIARRTWLAGAAALARGAQAGPEVLRLPAKVRLGLIGFEGHLSEVLGRLALVPDVTLVGVADPEPANLAAAARDPQASGARRYADYRQLLDREKPDMVAVYGTNAARPAAILEAAARGLPVVAEKPLAIEREDLLRVRAAVERSGIKLTMLLPMRFQGAYIAMKQVVEAGKIGEVVQISAQKSHKLGDRPAWMRKRSTFGGTIPYIGIHLVDAMRWIGGREFVEAASFQSRIGFPEYGEMENNTCTIFRMDNGGTAVVRMDYLRPESAGTQGDDRLRLAGTRGVVEYQANSGAIQLIAAGGGAREITAFPAAKSLFVDFLESVYLGKTPVLGWRDIYRANEIVLAARDAAERNRVTPV